ncbi:hypothetical protein KJ782_07050 [Patescibacteria group bacterium]|nr:hypothetical protein [Patescibacteria group bacterium]
MTTPARPRRFQLLRKEDVTGVSGAGIIVEGVEFTNGTVVFRWLSERASVTIFPREEGGMAGVLEKHGHDGKTVVVWLDHD